MSARAGWRRLRLVGLALAGAQIGHLVAYQVRFGAAAAALQGANVHAYFPSVSAIAGALLGVLLVASFALAGAWRLFTRPAPAAPRGSYLEPLAAAFGLQLAAFIGQEFAEAALSGAPLPEAASLILWGTLGQLPVAALAALAIWWLGPDVAAAVHALKGRPRLALGWAQAVPVRLVQPAPPAPLVAARGRLPLRRGPPPPS